MNATKRRAGTFDEKAAELGRRRPDKLRALETMVDWALDQCDKEGTADPAEYVWRCDDPNVTQPKGRR